MKKLLLLLCCWVSIAAAQDIPGTGFDKVRIVRPDEVIQADLQATKTMPDMRAELDYFWYSGNHIQSTQGGYSGRLLDGTYNVFYTNKNLKELGHFKAGLKDGLWRKWQEDGTLIDSYNWKSGRRNGEFLIYEKGQLKQTGTYRLGQLDGWITSYNGASAQKVYYQNGKVATYRPFWSRLFKKK